MSIYKVTKQFGGGKEQLSRNFKTLAEAKANATECATDDAAMKIKVVYRVYEFDDLISTVDSDSIQSAPSSVESTGASGGKQSGSTFRPTPFATAPRPGGTAPNWLKDADEDDKSKK